MRSMVIHAVCELRVIRLKFNGLSTSPGILRSMPAIRLDHSRHLWDESWKSLISYAT